MCLAESALPATLRPRSRGLPWAVGFLVSTNFALFWALPILLQGQLFHLALKRVLTPLFHWLDSMGALRRFAAAHIYSKPQYADFFATSLLTALNILTAFGALLYLQLTHGTISWRAHAMYNLAWVGFGGRMMGAAYTLAHKEGHNPLIYQRWWRKWIGNVFENWLGVLYGNVPYNFQTSHNHIHHALDAGKGDSFYCWDLDRSSLSDFVLYTERALRHMVGTSSLRYFKLRGMGREYALLRRGMVMFWVVTPLLLGLITRSPWFLFVAWLQPLLAMTTFLALINWGFHSFIEFDEKGRISPLISALTIVDGEDDTFGEDDHISHHLVPQKWHTQVRSWREDTHMEDIKKVRGSVFQKVSIPELAALITLGKFERIAQKHFVDYSGKLSQAEIAAMLRRRAQTKEMNHDEYVEWQRRTDAELLASLKKSQ